MLVLVLAVCVLCVFACKRSPKRGTLPNAHEDDDYVSLGKFPQVIGSWFFKYADQPKPGLYVALFDGSGSGVKEVTADLKSPSRLYSGIKLSVDADPLREWKTEYGTEIDFLQAPLEGGIWFIAKIKVISHDGSWCEYYADQPYLPFLLKAQNSEGVPQTAPKIVAFVGSLYVTERDTNKPIYYFNSFPSKNGAEDKPLSMHIYSANDLVRWLAMNEEPHSVLFRYPRIALPLSPGDTYYICVSGRYSQIAHYSMLISDSGFQDGPTRKANGPDRYEPDDQWSEATSIGLGELQNHSLFSHLDSKDGLKTWDDDWYVFHVPK